MAYTNALLTEYGVGDLVHLLVGGLTPQTPETHGQLRTRDFTLPALIEQHETFCGGTKSIHT